MAGMPVVLVLAAAVILAGVVVVAMGKGGELALPRPDSAALRRALVTPADMATFRPPSAFLGYSAQVTDEALRRIARVVAERDSELAMLRHELAVLRAREFQPGGPGHQAGYADPGSYADPGAYAATGTYADLGTDPDPATPDPATPDPPGTPSPSSDPGDTGGYGSPLSFSAAHDPSAPLEPYESELGTSRDFGDPGDGRDVPGPGPGADPGADPGAEAEPGTGS
jgi:hypothetical protein